MEKIKKYLLFAFLLENIAAQTRLLGRYSDLFFYAFLAIGAFFLFSKEIWSIRTIKACWWAYAMALVYIVYEFLVGSDTISRRTLLYLIAKITTFVIILVSVRTNFRFYQKQMLYPMAIVLCFFLIYGILTGQGYQGDGERLMLGYTNPNTTSWMGATSIGCLIFARREWNKVNVLLLIISIYGLLAGGSRAAVLIMGIFILLRYGIRSKIIIPIVLGYVIAVYLLPLLGLQTIGMQRMQDTIAGKEGNNRGLEREATKMMIAQKPLTGWGLEAQNVGAAAALSELGSHNGYMETIKFMGYPMGGLWIAILVVSTLLAIWKIRKRKLQFDFYVAYALALLVIANYESMFVGVHEYATNLFFVSLAIISFRPHFDSKHRKATYIQRKSL